MSRHKTEVTALLAGLPENAAFLSTDGQPFVILPTGQTLPLYEPVLRDWLTSRYARQEGHAPSQAALQDGIRTLRGRAYCESKRAKVALRIGRVPVPQETIYIDLANERSEAIEITEHGWQLSRFSPGITFRSTRGQLSLPSPATDDERTTTNGILTPAVQHWLLSALRPTGPYPILILHGPPGSGKTTLARMLRHLIDPVTAPITALPSRHRAIEQLAARNRVLVFDHVTHMSNSAADALCRIASGTGIEVNEPGDRRDPLMLDTARPIIITTPRQGLDDWQPRPDLAARCIAVHCPAIENKRPQAEIEAEFETTRPHIQAQLYTALSRAMKHKNDERTTTNDERSRLYESSAQNDPVFQAIAKFAARRAEWTGTATDLLPHLGLPNIQSPRSLAQRLNLLAPFLTAAGIQIEHHRKHNGTRHITLRKNSQEFPSPTGLDRGNPNDERTTTNDERVRPTNGALSKDFAGARTTLLKEDITTTK